jgi:tetratricopeptide (TPR) repeat protein
MISAFPTTKAYFIAGLSLSFLISTGMIRDGRSLSAALLGFLLGVFISWFISSLIALTYHRKLLNILYRAMKPKDFIAVYSPVAENDKTRKNIHFSMMCFLSNAYSAAGEYDTALEVLNSIQVLGGRKRQQCKAILTGNRCDIYCAMKNIALAKKEYSDLNTMVNAGETSQKLILELLKVKINLLEENVSEEDCETVRSTLKGNLTPLFQLQLRYLLAQLYEQQGEYEFAQTYYEETSSGDEQLAIVREAKTHLNERA